MKKRKNTLAKIMATIALLAIIIGIIGTGVLVIVNSFTGAGSSDYPEISEEEIQQYLETLSGSTSVAGSGVTIQTGQELIDQGETASDELQGESDSENTSSETTVTNEETSFEESSDFTEETDNNGEEIELEAEIDIQYGAESSGNSIDIIESLEEVVSE